MRTCRKKRGEAEAAVRVEGRSSRGSEARQLAQALPWQAARGQQAGRGSRQGAAGSPKPAAAGSEAGLRAARSLPVGDLGLVLEVLHVEIVHFAEVHLLLGGLVQPGGAPGYGRGDGRRRRVSAGWHHGVEGAAKGSGPCYWCSAADALQTTWRRPEKVAGHSPRSS